MPGCMRYPDSGGLSAQGRVRREMVRLDAARMFEHDVRPAEVARQLRVSPRCRCARRRAGVKIAGGTARDVVFFLVADEAAGQPDAGSRLPRGC